MKNLIFVGINPDTGKTIGVNLYRKTGRYQFRSVKTKRFIGGKEFRRACRKIYGMHLTDKANGAYTAYERQVIKDLCGAEIVGIWTSPDNIKNFHKGASLVGGRVIK